MTTLYPHPLLKTFKIPQLLASWLLLLSGQVVSSSTSIPAFLSIADYSDLYTTEAPVDFGSDNPDDLFKAAVMFEWDRVQAHDQTQFPFFVCNAEPNMSGYKRSQFISETFGVDDDTTWLANAYNDAEKSCFIMNMGGRNALDSYYAIPSETRDYTTVNPMLQSMKMAMGMVDEMQTQLETVNDKLVNISKAEFTVTFLPGVIVRGREPNAQAQGDIVNTFIRENTDAVLSSSFYYQTVNDVPDNSTESVFEEDPKPEPTERMNFWADALGSGLLSAECTELLERVKFFYWPRLFDTVTVSLTMGGGMMDPSTEDACVWSLIQGFALHHSTAFLEPFSDDKADDDMFLGGNFTTGKISNAIDENQDVIDNVKSTVKDKVEQNDGKIKDLIEDFSSGSKMSFSMFAFSHLVFLALCFW